MPSDQPAAPSASEVLADALVGTWELCTRKRGHDAVAHVIEGGYVTAERAEAVWQASGRAAPLPDLAQYKQMFGHAGWRQVPLASGIEDVRPAKSTLIRTEDGSPRNERMREQARQEERLCQESAIANPPPPPGVNNKPLRSPALELRMRNGLPVPATDLPAEGEVF